MTLISFLNSEALWSNGTMSTNENWDATARSLNEYQMSAESTPDLPLAIIKMKDSRKTSPDNGCAMVGAEAGPTCAELLYPEGTKPAVGSGPGPATVSGIRGNVPRKPQRFSGYWGGKAVSNNCLQTSARTARKSRNAQAKSGPPPNAGCAAFTQIELPVPE